MCFSPYQYLLQAPDTGVRGIIFNHMVFVDTFSKFLLSPSIYGSKRCNNRIFSSIPSPFLSSRSFLKLKKRTYFSTTQINWRKNQSVRSSPVYCSGQSGLLRVALTVCKVGKNGIEVGTKLVPDAIPRPIARIAVTIVALAVASFVLKTFLSALFFALVSDFAFLALNNDERPKGGGGSSSVEDCLEEARRIMDKYK